jgi:hypothetical protein|tara:strand:+ start:16175 stop:16336 length:162 start_codon:yes stop_codon:yes gene_type:complete
MEDSQVEIKKFIKNLSKEDYAAAHKNLKSVLHEKTKKRCSDEYDRIKKSFEKK